MGDAIDRADVERVLSCLAGKYNAESVFLFGSYARGEQTGDSDIDVLVEGGSAFVPSDVFAIAEELHIATGKRVDVYEASEIVEGTEFAESIERDRVRVA